jgi:3-carboxy-cis,cis-muconate cycloisomerase
LPSETGLFEGIYARGDSAAQVSDQAWLQAMLDVEAALSPRA